MRTGTNYFLANLAFADLLVAIFCILQNMIHIVGFDHGNWTLGTSTNLGYDIVYTLVRYAVVTLSFDVYEHWRDVVEKWKLHDNDRTTEKRHHSDSQSGAPTNASWQMSNGKTIVYKQDSLLQVPSDMNARRRTRDLTETRRKVVRLLIVLVASFAILTLPHHARQLHTMWSTTPQCNNDWSILLQPLSYIFLFMSSTLNPILYAFLSKRFREAASDIFYCK
ncbi:hypothetical protein DICVIV_03459 [Dictyocaulus viviparus]|uniref:Thyrotropin-releasing hormone receptor n=1 Tax=Dictyocaulus viviparus TaxID=29172 RepID=A0A0D8Y2Y4_DICVI|nr:hypothetical protein DICVIV_03459 [Dictyocaulus viviparus]